MDNQLTCLLAGAIATFSRHRESSVNQGRNGFHHTVALDTFLTGTAGGTPEIPVSSSHDCLLDTSLGKTAFGVRTFAIASLSISALEEECVKSLLHRKKAAQNVCSLLALVI